MSDESEGRDGGERGRRDEPLGDLAAEVRERTGDRPANERPEPSDREGPLADVASAVDERRRRKATGGDDAFESVDVGDLDGERLWEQLAEDDDGPSVAVPTEETEVADADGWGGGGESGSGRGVRTIPTDTCHGCPHFGDPPELACTREGTQILAMPDTDHFRVADCPMVVDGEEDIEPIADAPSDGGEDVDSDGATDGDAVADAE